MDKEITSSTIKRKQYVNLAALVVAILVIFWVVYSLVSKGNAQPKSANPTEIGNFESPLAHVDEANVLIERTQNKLAKQQKDTETLKEQMEKLTEAKLNQEKQNQLQSEQVQTLSDQITTLQQQLTKTQSVTQPDAGETSTFPPQSASSEVRLNGLSENVLQLTQGYAAQSSSMHKPLRTPDTYVPSGTFAKAVMMGGADASAGINSQGNPMPVLFRIVEAGNLPNQRKSHLKGCVVTAAAMGDISSERGHMRLENLSCVASNGEVIDMSVEGTVFGTEGKNGVRGRPLWREGSLIKRAFVAGTLSGFSEGISEQYTTTSVSPLGATSTVNGGDIFKYGAASGMSNAMDKLADYNIRRADQYHPVIQLSAGTIVDIVFLKGFYLDGKKHDDNDQEIPIHSPFAQNTAPRNSLPLTAHQINALKAKAVMEEEE